ncbi:CBS domain-containing protein [Amycolatopsis anabasis]|uniref:CBS domain-containing protein n=1 Tax=Amycolatopsis anabasis TaxID=1840409 RepID=UPI00131E830D|nr:CBS domain-containing protein [Amycolatopsis anabasis]
MRANEIMSSPVVSITTDTTIREAIALLTERGFAGLPVVDQDNKVIGVFTETDALRGGAAHRTVAETMTTPVEVAGPDTEVADIGRRMLTDRLRCIPVVDNGTLVGVVSRRDLLRPMIRRDDAIAAHVRALLTDYSGHRNRWTVAVTGGVVTLTGEFADNAERGVLGALARTVPGVVHTEFVTNRQPTP